MTTSPKIRGAILGRDLRREIVGGIPTPQQSLSRVYFPPSRGPWGLWALVPLAFGPWVPMAPGEALSPWREERVLDLVGR